MTELRDRLVDGGYAAGWAVVRGMPQPLARALFRLGADASTRRGGRGVRQLRANLRRVIGPEPTEAELDALVRVAVRSYARYWMETFRLPVMPADTVLPRVHSIGSQHIDEAVQAGRGAILALPHSGNWDVSAVWLIARGYPFTTVAERLEPESLYNRFVAYREGLGMEVLPLTGGDRPPSDVLAERLRAGRVVCLVADRDLTRAGVEVDFFGETARMPAGAALLAATTGAALLPVGLWFDRDATGQDSWGQWIHPPVPIPAEGRLRDRVRAATQSLADTFAADVAAHPADWHMLQRLWLADLPPRRPDGRAEPPVPPPGPAELADPVVLVEPAEPVVLVEPVEPVPGGEG